MIDIIEISITISTLNTYCCPHSVMNVCVFTLFSIRGVCRRKNVGSGNEIATGNFLTTVFLLFNEMRYICFKQRKARWRGGVVPACGLAKTACSGVIRPVLASSASGRGRPFYVPLPRRPPPPWPKLFIPFPVVATHRFLLFLNVETYLFYLLLFVAACSSFSRSNYDMPGVLYRPPLSGLATLCACALPAAYLSCAYLSQRLLLSYGFSYRCRIVRYCSSVSYSHSLLCSRNSLLHKSWKWLHYFWVTEFDSIEVDTS